jgi:3'(2'), 5'-bisphosphate nucleotidase
VNQHRLTSISWRLIDISTNKYWSQVKFSYFCSRSKQKMIEALITLAKVAGKEILQVYNDPSQQGHVDYKADDSPLTKADTAANKVIIEGLSAMPGNFPILSEEEKHQPYAVRQHWTTFWLVDPLDGTKEFINRNGEFTVNIALIKDGNPILGVIYVPVKDLVYWGDKSGAFKIENGAETSIKVNYATEKRIAVRSKSHASPAEEAVLARYDVVDSISVGSSLKFCMVAEGKADIYYRHGPTMEWDTGAGQAILQAAAGRVYAGDSEEELFRYNKENLLNGSFLCLGF